LRRHTLATLAGVAALGVLSALPAKARTAPAGEVSAIVSLDGWRNAQGGARRGSILVAAAQLTLQVDAERAFGWRGASFALAGLYSDKAVASDLVGDIHTVDNRDAPAGANLYEAWVRQAFAGGYAKAGVIDLNTEFAVNNTGALFINGAQGLGLEMAQLGWRGPSTYPRPRAAAVASLAKGGAWKLGVFSGARADPDAVGRRPRGTPTLAVLESAGGLGAHGRLTLGAWRHSANYGSSLAAPGRRAGLGGYGLLEQSLWRGGGRRLDGFLRLGLADPKAQAIASDLAAGLVLASPFVGREGEAAGLAVLRSTAGARFRRLEPAAPRHETVVEATYRLPLGHGLALQPDAQYVIRPGGAPGQRDAVVFGVRLDGAWSRAF